MQNEKIGNLAINIYIPLTTLLVPLIVYESRSRLPGLVLAMGEMAKGKWGTRNEERGGFLSFDCAALGFAVKTEELCLYFLFYFPLK